MQHRVMGNLIFMSLRDATGDLQIAVSKKTVGQPAFSIAKAIDYGDIIVAAGPLAKTKTGEITLWSAPEVPPEGEDAAASGGGFELATKSLAPPPSKFHGLTDPELRYRKRYVDLYANPEVMRLAQTRIRIINEIRDYLRGRGFMEVETPMLQSVHGGAAARPFKTHHNALDMPLYLRIAPELYLKRLLVGGMPKVFEINRNFRNEGVSPRHNPEFTMLEAYEAFGNWETMAELVEDMVCTVAQRVFGTLKLEHKDADGNVRRTINLARPWRRVSMAELVAEYTEERGSRWDFDKQPLPFEQFRVLFKEPLDHEPGSMGDLKKRNPEQYEIEREQQDQNAYNHVFGGNEPAEHLVTVYEKLIEHTLVDPTFVTRVPGVVIPLAKRCKDDDYFADVYELAINGVEISPGYSELNDPDIQEKQFRGQVGDREEQQQVDEDFLEALRVGMPPAGGMGLGIDRLIMMLTGAESIRDVILFPLMRPREQ